MFTRNMALPAMDLFAAVHFNKRNVRKAPQSAIQPGSHAGYAGWMERFSAPTALPWYHRGVQGKVVPEAENQMVFPMAILSTHITFFWISCDFLPYTYIIIISHTKRYMVYIYIYYYIFMFRFLGLDDFLDSDFTPFPC